MKNQSLFAIAILSIIFACGSPNGNLKGEVESFKILTDSLLVFNTDSNSIETRFDTTFTERPSADDPQLVVIDTLVEKQSRITYTSKYYNDFILPTMNKYISMEQHLDSAKAKMDAKTLELFESIKQKMNEIKQPIK
ncbi:MAG: hypothetical protein ACOYMA_17055 [Bacteroidia bacterium]